MTKKKRFYDINTRCNPVDDETFDQVLIFKSIFHCNSRPGIVSLVVWHWEGFLCSLEVYYDTDLLTAVKSSMVQGPGPYSEHFILFVAYEWAQ